MKYSVIVPVYQAEKTIERCLNSLACQEEADAEILLINDGSTDRSGALCKERCRADSRFHYYEKENGGVSSARNMGLEIAKGDYILFVDSDDYVSEDYFQTLNALLRSEFPDMLLFSAAAEKNGRTGRIIRETEAVFQDGCALARYIASRMNCNSFGRPYTVVFSRSIISEHRLQFPKGLSIAEDLAFAFSYAVHARRAVSTERVLYYIDESDQSSLSRKPKSYLEDHLAKANEIMFEALESAQAPRDVKTAYRKALKKAHYRSVYSVAKESLRLDCSEKERKRRIRSTCRRFTHPFRWPEDPKCAAMAVPVILRCSALICYLARRRTAGPEKNKAD